MKILYGAGNYNGANLQLSRFLSSDHEFEVRIAAYFNNNENLECIDWCLDALKPRDGNQKELVKDLFEKKFPIDVDFINIRMMLEDIANWDPDIAIIDFEPITYSIAKVLKIKCISCSPLNMLDGVEWGRGIFTSYYKSVYKARQILSLLSGSDYKFIYSPFCDVFCRPALKNNYEWIRPYYTEPEEIKNDSLNIKYILANTNNTSMHNGETSYLADSIYDNKISLLFPNYNDLESILNTILCEEYNIGFNMGKLNVSLDYTENSINKFKLKEPKIELNIMQSCKFLHEKIGELCSI